MCMLQEGQDSADTDNADILVHPEDEVAWLLNLSLHDILRWKRTYIDSHCYLGCIDCVRLGSFKKVMHTLEGSSNP